MENSALGIYMQKDGFYVGRLTKTGKMARGALKITDEDIVNMFSAYFSAYCAANDTDSIMVEDGADFRFFAKLLPTKLGEQE